MKIRSVKTALLKAPLTTPFKTALRTVDSLEDVIVIIETETGLMGFGEAPPTAAITGETIDSLLRDITGPIREALVGKDLDDPQALFTALDHCLGEHHSSAKAAADIAIYDLLGQIEGKAVCEMLSDQPKDVLITDLTISVNDPEVMAEDARKAIKRGFKTLKIKVGVNPDLDLARLSAVRKAVGPDVNIRIDANQAWTPEQAVELISRMGDEGICPEFVEQPVEAHDLEGLKYVTDHSPYPIVADESCFTADDAVRIYDEHLADMVNIKLMKCGGLHQALRITDAAERAGAECMIGCMLEAKVSVDAAIALAAAKDCITRIDLDGPALLAKDPVIGGSTFNGPEILVGKGKGFGVEKIEGLEMLDL